MSGEGEGEGENEALYTPNSLTLTTVTVSADHLLCRLPVTGAIAHLGEHASSLQPQVLAPL